MKRERHIVIIIFFLAMLLRLWLALLNREANDNHVDVVIWIVDKHCIPEKIDCWSCYQPKLYYIICAGLVQAFHVQDFYDRIEIMQLVNVFISFLILLVFWKFISKQTLSIRSKLIAFAFFAFNPCLIGINVQGTNDTPVIFCGVLALYAADSFFSIWNPVNRNYKSSSIIILASALILGALTKASALVLFAAVMIVFSVKILIESESTIKWKVTKYFLTLIITFILIVPFAGGYFHNYKQYGSFTLSTWNHDPPPYFFKTTPVVRPGVLSMFDAFFTFRYLDMIRQPYIANEWNDEYPLHRTSLWSQLYGRTMFMHFDEWPPGWQSKEKFIFFVGRVLLSLGIIPLLLFLLGLAKNFFVFTKHILKRNREFFSAPNNYLHLIVTVAFLCSSVFYSYNYRDFSSMKSIYIFPAFLSFIKLFVDGLKSIKPKFLLSAIEIILVLIILFSIADVAFLIHQLSH